MEGGGGANPSPACSKKTLPPTSPAPKTRASILSLSIALSLTHHLFSSLASTRTVARAEGRHAAPRARGASARADAMRPVDASRVAAGGAERESMECVGGWVCACGGWRR